MNTNPVIKPKVATPVLILASAAVLILAGYLVFRTAAGSPSSGAFLLAEVVLLLAAAALLAIWFGRLRRRNAWMAAAEEKWRHFDDAKRTHRTTTEITVLSVDALEPMGSWITIKWNRFDHVQRAWLEAMVDPIWAGSILLIQPDPAQIRPGTPWPTTYYIGSSDCLAWAPMSSDGRR